MLGDKNTLKISMAARNRRHPARGYCKLLIIAGDKMSKIMCGKCKWFYDVPDDLFGYIEICDHPKNKKKVYDHAEEKTVRRWKPDKKNKHNDCEHFKRGFWK